MFAALLLALQEAETGTIRGQAKKDAVVYVREIAGRTFEPPKKNPKVLQKNAVFQPHLLPVVVGTTVDFPNDDDVKHGVFAEGFNLGVFAPGEVRQVKFEKLGIEHLQCNLHAEMSAYILVLQNPCFAVTDDEGKFEIRDVPAGAHAIAVFHEKFEAADASVEVKPGATADVAFGTWKRKKK